MIRRLVVVTLSLIACHMQAPLLHAESDSAGLIPPSVAQQYGLERAWFTQTRVSPLRGETPYLHLHVSQTRSQTICRVTDQHGQVYDFSERHLDLFGKPLGVEGAQKAAAEKVRLLSELNGISATVEQQVVPDITLYISSSGGVVQAADAETGRIRWTLPVGRSDYYTTELAANDEVVGLINGQDLYILHAADGTLVDKRRVVGGAPAAGPALLGTKLFVPTLSGQLHSYQFGPGEPRWPGIYRSKGTVRFAPTSVGSYVMWPTDAGIITAIDPSRFGARFRLQLGDPIAGPLVFAPPTQVLTVTTSGYLYSFDVRTGGIMWRYSTGDATAEPASVVDDTVYVVSAHAGMRAVTTATGEEKWWAQGVKHFVAATKDRVCVTTGANVLTVLDAQNGKVLAAIPLHPKDRAFVNNQTDRIYIGTETGLMQCLHMLGAHWPTIHVTGAEVAAAAAAQAQGNVLQQSGSKTEAEGAKKAAPADPFATGPAAGADPFGGKPAAEKEPPADEEPAKKEPPADEGPAEKEPATGKKPATEPEANPFEDGSGDGAEKPAAEADGDSSDQ